ncbi:MAG: AbrB/MazE/SpoVT family DNA-binding domain-containing protein [Gemmatimonadaceae bacterium]
MTPVAKITAKGQTTIPREIRDALEVKPGDLIAWEIRDSGRVEVRRVQPADVEYLRAIQETLSEWNSPEDGDAYRDL